MSTEELDKLLERMPKIAEAVNAFESETVQQEAFISLIAAFSGKTIRTLAAALPEIDQVSHATPEQVEPQVSDASEQKSSTSSGRKSRKKSNSLRADWTLNKDLDLHPPGKISFEDFAAEKQPKSNEDKYAVVVYYLEEILEFSPITRNEVGTVFRRMSGWQESANVGSGLRVTQSRKSTVNCTELDDIKITPAGRNFVEHKLPAAKAPAK
ncbi:hypothetical protein [Agrobacterium sp. MCAB5]|uniref:hypothetical protein n=1 Tax=Agrobacterium sp. MCAB5 TaxID=3233042 RepID=UPI003F92617F